MEWVVWLVEAHAQEERLLALHFDQANRLGRDLAVGLVFVAPIGREPAAPREPAAGEVASLAAKAGRGRREVAAIDPRFRVLEGRRPATGVEAQVQDLAEARGEVPLLAKELGSVTTSGSLVRNAVPLSRVPVVSGRFPVRNEVRLGLQTGYWQYARSNRTPRAARRSMLGDLTWSSP